MSTENLHNQEAIDKLTDLVNKIDIGMLCTYATGQQYIHSVPMSRQEVDDQGNIWYLFSSDSLTYDNLQNDKRVSVLFSQPSDYNFLNVHGTAEISQDQSRIDKYWNKFMEGWFEKGKNDPHIRVLKVNVKDANYWDNKTNKLFTFFKVAASALTGAKMDIGREGNLNL